MLLLDNEDVRRVLTIEACLEALERAYVAQANGGAVLRPRSQIYVPLAEPGLSYCLKTMDGVLPETGYAVLRLTSDIINEADVDGVMRREKVPRGPNGTYCGLIILFSLSSLAPVAIIHDGYIQVLRVACSSALSAKLLARPDAGDLGLLGSSDQAWAHLVALAAVRKLRRVRVYSPSPERREIFAGRARGELGLQATAVASARAAVEGADLVVAATNTSEPIVDGAWIAPGAHVVSIASSDEKRVRRELDDETLRRASVVIAHSKRLAREQGHGDLAGPVAAGILDWEHIHDLSDLVVGRAPGRGSPEDITVFKNNVGLALQFAAVAPRVYEMARRAGAGRQLPDEWFLEHMKP